MVTIDSYQKLTRVLELYLLKQVEGNLPVTISYALIALIPVDPNAWVDRQTLLLSLSGILNKSRREITHDLFTLLKKSLLEEDYSAIYNIDFLAENSFAVQQLNAWERSRNDDIFTAPIGIMGGVTPQNVTIIRSSVLKKLAYYQSVRVHLSSDEFFAGKLTDLILLETDVQLTFQTDQGPRKCMFTDIMSILSL